VIDWVADSAARLERVRTERPLVHHITNFVTMNDVANVTLAIGASPVMAHAIEEVAEVTRSARALCLNLGTPSADRIDAMLAAGQTAGRLGIPVVFDPVGVGATQFRAAAARRLLEAFPIYAIRGNASEIGALSGSQERMRGVNAGQEQEDVSEAVRGLAARYHCTAAATGRKDMVGDESRVVGIENGHRWFTQITGAGCMSTAVVAAFAAVERDALGATVSALLCYGIAGEIAAERSQGVGSFKVALMDALFALSPAQLRERAKVKLLT
jgi:hydroxyethylthiazole kinase